MIREKISQVKTDYTIGKELGIYKNTVKKYRESPVSQHALKGSKRASKLDPFRQEIEMLLNRGIYNCQVIFCHIKEQGYTGKITILKDYVKQFRPAKIAPAVHRYESPPGQQAQMDWGISMETGNPLWNKRFEEFAADIGFIPKVCRPKHPQTEGEG